MILMKVCLINKKLSQGYLFPQTEIGDNKSAVLVVYLL